MFDRFPDIPRAPLPGGPEALLRTTLALHALGMQLTEQRIRRDHPGSSDEEVQREVRAWLRGRGLDGWRDGFRVRRG